MCPDELSVALIIPNIDVYSGAVERTVRLIEHAAAARIRYVVFLPSKGVPNVELGRELDRLERAGCAELRRLSASQVSDGSRTFDVVAIPTEYWWGAWKRARAAGVQGQFCFEFHLLPYVGTLDLLKTIGIEHPGLHDLLRLPFLMRRRYEEGLVHAAYETIACVASILPLAGPVPGRILAISAAIAKHLRAVGFQAPVTVPRHPNGIQATAVRNSLQDDVPLKYDAIYAGRFHPQKGFLDLPRIVAEMKKYLGPDVNVAVCGGTTEAEHWKAFSASATALGVAQNLTLLGRVQKADLYAAIRSSQALLYPSYVDGFPITVLESLCLGVPVVGYDTDALAMVWGEERAVVRVPVGDAQGLGRSLAYARENGRLQEGREAARGRSSWWLSEYTWENVARDQRVFYEGTDGAT